jgi:16S rRNA (cytosine967-C5)-methyltransferase
VNEAVDLEGRYRGLVNAVLRNAARQSGSISGELESMSSAIEGAGLKGGELEHALSVSTSHPLWLVRRWLGRFGTAEALEFLRANNEVPTLTLRVNSLRSGRDEVLERLSGMGMEAAATLRSPVGVRLTGSVTFRELEPLSGLVMAQDEAAQLVTYMLGLEGGERVLDTCAAPGGKAAHMAELMGDSGEVVAVEEDAGRTEALRENVTRMGYRSVRVLTADVAEMDPTAMEPFDAVLVDAPCSALGVIRRNPDIKGRRSEDELERFSRRQLELLLAAARFVRPGGRLLYCTCSTEPDEGEGVAEAFLQSRGDFYIIEDAPVPGGGLDGGMFRSYPHRDGMDGFFAVRFDRIK